MLTKSGFKILINRDHIPMLAACERCDLKFITPRDMVDPQVAEEYLRGKYENHSCLDAKQAPHNWTYPARRSIRADP